MNPARILYSLAAPLLGHLGSAVLHAARVESDRADAAERDCHHEQGRTSELRSLLHASNQALEASRADHGETIDERDEARREIATLRSELDSAAVDDDYVATIRQALADTVKERDALLNASAKHAAEVNALRTELAAAKEDVRASSAMGAIGAARFGEIHGKADAADKRAEECCVKLAAAEARIESMTTRLDESAASLRAEVDRNYHAVRDVNALRARVRDLEGQVDARADVALDAERCEWCRGPLGVDRTEVQDFRDPGSCLYVCKRCWGIPHIYTAEINERVALRARCHPARLTADPTADACITCGAASGEECSGGTIDEARRTLEAAEAGTVDPHCSRCATYGHTFRECMRPAGY